MSPGPDNGQSPQNIATAISDVSERASVLVREEIELAKAEVSEKVSKLIRGAAVAAAAGIFVLTGLFLLLFGVSWLFAEWFNKVSYGFFAVAGILFVLGALAGFLAARWLKNSSPPVPEMAIEEAKKIKETVSSEVHSHES